MAEKTSVKQGKVEQSGWVCPWCKKAKLQIYEGGQNLNLGYYAGCSEPHRDCPDTTGIFSTKEALIEYLVGQPNDKVSLNERRER